MIASTLSSESISTGPDGDSWRHHNHYKLPRASFTASPFDSNSYLDTDHKPHEDVVHVEEPVMVGNLDKFRSTNIYANRYRDTSSKFQGFWYLMTVWKGSVFKLVWHDLLIFLIIYFTLSTLYRCVFTQYAVAREIFELFCIYSSRFRRAIPITFLTGFYVSEVVRRYWDQFVSLPYPDKLALKLVTFIPGKDNFSRNLRRTVMRYVNLSHVLVFRLVSGKVHARFPSYESLVQSRLLLPHEAERMTKVETHTPHEATWAPILWALKLLQRSRSEGKISLDPPVYASLVGSFDYLESANRRLLNHGWVNFPLAYTQVATLSVYSYFLVSLFGSQFLIPHEKAMDTDTLPSLNISLSSVDPFDKHTPDMYLPLFTILEFISYMGWIKVAEALLNPFGDDDEDLEINYLIDRNLQVSYMIVDHADLEVEMAQDPFLEAGMAIAPPELPYMDDSLREESARLVRHGSCNTSLQNVRRRSSRLRKMSRLSSGSLFGHNKSEASLKHDAEEPPHSLHHHHHAIDPDHRSASFHHDKMDDDCSKHKHGGHHLNREDSGYIGDIWTVSGGLPGKIGTSFDHSVILEEDETKPETN